jgi:peptidoglycan/LPS O-acetylase OafA/YrhL
MKQHFDALDTLRTLMALGVAAGHYFYWNQVGTLYPWAFFLAVDFFFVLSGFVLTRSALLDRAASDEEFLGKFAIRRAYRLFPLYWVLFIPCTLLLILKGAADPTHYYATSALLLQAMGFDAGAKAIFADTTIGIAWSISVEFWVGLLWFPVVYKLRAKPAALMALSAFVAIVSLALIANYSPNVMNVNLQRLWGPITFGAMRGLLGFALGTIAWLAYTACERRQHSTALMTVIEGALIVALLALFVRNSYNHSNEVVAPLLFVVLIVAAALGNGLVSRALEHRMWAPIRPLSYAIYLLHPFAVFAWRNLPIPFTHRMLPVYLALILIAAYFCYRFIEAPFIAMGKKAALSNEKVPAIGAPLAQTTGSSKYGPE